MKLELQAQILPSQEVDSLEALELLQKQAADAEVWALLPTGGEASSKWLVWCLLAVKMLKELPFSEESSGLQAKIKILIEHYARRLELHNAQPLHVITYDPTTGEEIDDDGDSSPRMAGSAFLVRK
jgi:hypothetical protein